VALPSRWSRPPRGFLGYCSSPAREPTCFLAPRKTWLVSEPWEHLLGSGAGGEEAEPAAVPLQPAAPPHGTFGFHFTTSTCC